MRGFRYISSLLLPLIIVVTSSCKHIFLSKDEISWFDSWNDIDTLYFVGCGSINIDTVIVNKLYVLQPRTTNQLSLNPNQWNTGNDRAYVELGFSIKHLGQKTCCSLFIQPFDEKNHCLELHVNDKEFSEIPEFEEVASNEPVIKLAPNLNHDMIDKETTVKNNRESGQYDENTLKNYFDYFTISRNSALIEYSYNGCKFRRLN